MAASQADADDYWARAVTLFTGYPLPSRKSIFEKLTSTEGIPLFRMGLKDMGVRAVTSADYAAISGWMTHKGEDYDLVFYTAKGGDGAHGNVEMKRARIVLIGVPADDNGRAMLLDPGSMMMGGEFTGVMGNEWDSRPMAQYIAGAKAALDALVVHRTTKGFQYNDLRVEDSDAVDLASFKRTAQAFDRAKKFFEEQTNTLEQWEKSLGGEHASWKGQAAGVFRGLILQVHSNYQNYVDQFGGKDYRATNIMIGEKEPPRSIYGDALAGAQRSLYHHAGILRSAWKKWASTGEHDPHRAVLEELNELLKWVIDNNVMQITKNVQVNNNSSGNLAPTTTYHTTSAFRQHHPEYGDLADEKTWKKIGEKAVERWVRQLEATLTPAATKALSGLNNKWLDFAGLFEEPLETKNKTSLSEAFQKEQSKKSQEGLDKINKDLNEKLSDLGKSLSNLGTGVKNGLNSALNDLGTEFEKSSKKRNADSSGAAEEITKNLNSLGGLFNGLRNGGVSPDSSKSPATTSLNSLLGQTPAFNLNAGMADTNSGLKNPDGSTTKLNSDGSLTTTHPDGSLSHFNPATGTMATISRDGKTKIESLSPGVALTNPDGSTTTLNPDGTLTMKFPDGSSTVINPSTGSAVTTQPDGSVSTQLLNPSAGTVTTPGGGTTALNSDGSLTTKFPDGSIRTVGSDGTVTTTKPDGSVTTTDLNSKLGSGRGGPPSLPGGTHTSGLSDFPGSSSFTSNMPGASTSLNSNLGGLNSGGDSSFEEYDSTPYSGGSLGAPTSNLPGSDASRASGGVPLNAGALNGMGGMGGMGGMPMGGMPAGGSGGGSSNSERVRNVLSESDGASRRKSRARSAGEEEEMVFTRGGKPTTTSSPYLPMGGQGTQGGQSTETSDRERSSWVPEDEDVWGTDEGGAPAVIGR